MQVLLPLALIASASIRISLVSFTYLLFLLLWAPMPMPSHTTSRWPLRITGVLALFAGLVCLAHVIFQIYLASSTPYASSLSSHTAGMWLQLGLCRMDLNAGNVVRLTAPDFIVFFLALVSWRLCLNDLRGQGVPRDGRLQTAPNSQAHPTHLRHHDNIRGRLLMALSFASLALAAVVAPSIPNALYIIYGIGVALSAGGALGVEDPPPRPPRQRQIHTHHLIPAHAPIMVLLAVHICLLYLFQFSFTCSWPESDAALVGLVRFWDTCSTPALEDLSSYNTHWPIWLLPFALLGAYLILVRRAYGNRELEIVGKERSTCLRCRIDIVDV